MSAHTAIATRMPAGRARRALHLTWEAAKGIGTGILWLWRLCQAIVGLALRVAAPILIAVMGASKRD